MHVPKLGTIQPSKSSHDLYDPICKYGGHHPTLLWSMPLLTPVQSKGNLLKIMALLGKNAIKLTKETIGCHIVAFLWEALKVELGQYHVGHA